jgi:DNA-binding HxlR family transcriptional regulator
MLLDHLAVEWRFGSAQKNMTISMKWLFHKISELESKRGADLEIVHK